MIPPRPGVKHAAAEQARERMRTPAGRDAAVDRQAHAEGAIARCRRTSSDSLPPYASASGVPPTRTDRPEHDFARAMLADHEALDRARVHRELRRDMHSEAQRVDRRPCAQHAVVPRQHARQVGERAGRVRDRDEHAASGAWATMRGTISR